MMTEKFKNIFKFDDKILKTIKYCFRLSILICWISIIIMLIYNTYYISHNLYIIYLILLKTSYLAFLGLLSPL